MFQDDLDFLTAFEEEHLFDTEQLGSLYAQAVESGAVPRADLLLVDKWRKAFEKLDTSRQVLAVAHNDAFARKRRKYVLRILSLLAANNGFFKDIAQARIQLLQRYCDAIHRMELRETQILGRKRVMSLEEKKKLLKKILLNKTPWEVESESDSQLDEDLVEELNDFLSVLPNQSYFSSVYGIPPRIENQISTDEAKSASLEPVNSVSESDHSPSASASVASSVASVPVGSSVPSFSISSTAPSTAISVSGAPSLSELPQEVLPRVQTDSDLIESKENQEDMGDDTAEEAAPEEEVLLPEDLPFEQLSPENSPLQDEDEEEHQEEQDAFVLEPLVPPESVENGASPIVSLSRDNGPGDALDEFMAQLQAAGLSVAELIAHAPPGSALHLDLSHPGHPSVEVKSDPPLSLSPPGVGRAFNISLGVDRHAAARGITMRGLGVSGIASLLSRDSDSRRFSLRTHFLSELTYRFGTSNEALKYVEEKEEKEHKDEDPVTGYSGKKLFLFLIRKYYVLLLETSSDDTTAEVHKKQKQMKSLLSLWKIIQRHFFVTVSSFFRSSKGVDGQKVRDIALIASEIILGASRVLESMSLKKYDIESALKDSAFQCLLPSFLLCLESLLRHPQFKKVAQELFDTLDVLIESLVSCSKESSITSYMESQSRIAKISTSPFAIVETLHK
jgi:hypothetical protein